jgi:membrane-associated HD superfamily phosphohydrolase
MEKSEKDSKKKISRISRLGETKKLSLKENVHKAWKFFLSLLKEKFFLLFILCLFIALVNAPSLFIPSKTYQVGEVADFDIKASQDILVEDKIATDLRRQESGASVLSVYDFNEKTAFDLQKKIHRGFQVMREDLKKQTPGQNQKEDRLKLEKIWGIELTPVEFQALKKDRY